MKEQHDANLQELLDYLKRVRGFDFSGYKTSSLKRRIERRMQQIPVSGFGDYEDYLEVHPEEFTQLFNTILINVTDFFRDPPAWEYLQTEIVPRILEKKQKDDSIRVWSAGCASGQEAFSLAIIFAEALGANAYRDRVKVYATDADEDALSQARTGTYSNKQVHAVPEALLKKYFDPNNDSYTFRNDLRRSIIFGRHDLVQDAPISRLDLLVCRNTLMYFNSEVQLRIMRRLHFALNDQAFLFLGKAEMILTHSGLFTPVSLKYHIFGRVTNGDVRERLFEMGHAGDEDSGTRLAQQIRLREAAIELAPTPQIVVNSSGFLVLANERARAQFGLSPKDIGRPLQDLEISYRPVELRSLIEQAHAERRAVGLTDVQRHPTNGETQYLNLQVVPLTQDDDSILGAIITFIDVSQGHHSEQQLLLTAQGLERTSQELQSTNEELETTNEELQSANEELETTNEELQSANEELETMNEELQSTNEELYAVNEHLRQRTYEYNQIKSWLQSVLSIPPTALIVVDKNSKVLFWNQRAEDMWGLRFDEVEGKHLFALDMGLPLDELRAPIRACLDGKKGEPIVLQLQAINRRGKTIQCQVSISAFGDGSSQDIGVALQIEDTTQRARPA